MKKGILALGASLALAFTLSGCMLSFNLNNQEPTSKLGHSLAYEYKEGSYEAIKQTMDEVYNLLDEDNKFTEIIDKYRKINKYMEDIATYMNLENLETSISQSRTHDNNYLRLQTHLTNLFNWNNDFLLKASKSAYKASFFPNMTDEEIANSLDKKYDAEFYTLNGEVEKLLVEYRALDDKKMLKEAGNYYSKVVSSYNKMAKLAGYKNYLYYSYDEIYGREYDPSYIKSFNEFVKKYVVPELKESAELFSNIEANISKKYYGRMAHILTTPFISDTTLLDKYSEYVGGSYYLNYEELFDHGYYYFSNEKNALNGAYTTYLYNVDSPAVYFGPDYMDIMTVVHEYGHYFAYKENDGWSGSFDLAETQSQGNELVFLAFLEQETGEASIVTNAIRTYLLNKYLSNILLSTIVNDFELYVYENNIVDPNAYDNIFIDICSRYLPYAELKVLYGFELTDYWKYVALENAGYYISYAVSLIPALELYISASDNLNYGLNQLLDVIVDVRDDDGYIRTLSNAGLFSPFDGRAFKKIPELIEIKN